MNKVAGNLSLLGLWSTHPMHCLSCSNNSNFALFCLLYHVLYIKNMQLFDLLLLSCIRMWNKAVFWIKLGPFSCLATEWHLFFWFFFIFSDPQLRARHNYFHQGPRTLSGGKKGAKHSYCTWQEVSLFLYFYQCSSSRSFAGVKSWAKCSWIFKWPLNLRKRWINFSSKREVCHKKSTGDVLLCFFD